MQRPKNITIPEPSSKVELSALIKRLIGLPELSDKQNRTWLDTEEKHRTALDEFWAEARVQDREKLQDYIPPGHDTCPS